MAFEILVIARFEILDHRIYRVKLTSHLLQSSKGAFDGHARGKKADPEIGSSVIASDKIKQRKVFSKKRWNSSGEGFKHLREKVTIILTSI